MKKIIALFSMMLFVLSALCADIIITKEGKKIEGIVSEITSNEVKYKKASNPNGPLYSILISEIVMINYENGEQDLFSEELTESSSNNMQVFGQDVPQTVFTGTTGNHTDSELLRMYNNSNKDLLYIEVKRLKRIGWIGGSICATAAVGSFIAFCFSDDIIYYTATISAPLLGAGIIWTTSFLVAANNKKKKFDKELLYSMPIIQKEIFNYKGKSLDMCVNYISNHTNTRTVGLGLTYNF